MLIICPKCFTQYQIPSENGSLKGKKCHCSACGCYFEHEEEVLELTPKKEEKTALEKTMDIFDISEKKEEPVFKEEAYEPISLSLFNEPLNDKKEPKFSQSPFEYVPEEFKPVSSKKTPLLSLMIWLGVAAGICYAAYLQKDYLLNFMNKTIEKQFERTAAQPVKTKESITAVVPKMEPATLDASAVQPVVLNDLKELPVQNESAQEPQKTIGQAEIVTTVSEETVHVNGVEEVVNQKQVGDDLKEVNNLTQLAVQENNIEVNAEQNTVVDELKNMQPQNEMPVASVDALTVQNISYEIGLNEVGMERLLIRGVIANTSVYQQKLPLTKAVVYDFSDRVVARKRIVYLEKVIDGNSEIAFETSVVPSPKSVSKIEVNFDE
ncbi:MAG: hypothetical protein J6V53_06390 [Alphaproteobacteria bacterium]|nr:hypothetical protein [Alphaproteobacteria bacterium]